MTFMLNSATLSAETLASVLAQSVDCVALIGLDGILLWMNGNGQTVMEIDDFRPIKGRPWETLWPSDTQPLIRHGLQRAFDGEIVRFDAPCPTAKGVKRWWNVTISVVEDVAGDKVGFLTISRDITIEQTAREVMEIAAAELRHRLRNSYAIVSALIGGFAHGNAEHEAFARDMQDRLAALSTAQALFATDDAPRDLAQLVPALVRPFASPTCSINIDDLPCALVKQEQANAIALVLGELCVNSAKHGAAAAGGEIHIRTVAEGGNGRIVWTEQAARPVEGRDRPGAQGLTLVSRIMRARNGTFEIDWDAYGPVVTIGFPLLPIPAG